MLKLNTFVLLLCTAVFLSQPGSRAQNFMVPPDTDPQVIMAFNEGSRLLSMGQAAEAAKKYEIVIKALPNMGVAHYNYGVALGKIGRIEESVQELEKAASLQPNDQNIMANLGTTYQLAGRYPEAVSAYQKYLDVFPHGQYSQQISAQLQRLKMEVSKTHGQSSRGQDNYLSEAMAGGGGHWQASSMPVTIFIGSGGGCEGYREEFAAFLKESFLAWAEASQGKLSVAFVGKPDGAAIKCSWTDNPKDLSSPVEGGRTIVEQSSRGEIVRAQMRVLTINKSLGKTFSEQYMRHACLHEAGHALGLHGHSSGPGDIMFAAANYEGTSAQLSDRDKKTIYTLYSSPQ